MKGAACLLAFAVVATAHPARACDEVSDVVGYRRCTSFGDGWDLTYSGEATPAFAVRRSLFARSSYRPGTLTGPGDDASDGGRRLGCIDLRAQRVADPHAPPGSVVVAFTFGNGCDRSARMALSAVRVTAKLAGGRVEGLALYDPASEVHVATLDARDQAREVLQFDPRARGDVAASVCVDVSAVEVDGPHAAIPPICASEAREPVNEREVIGHNALYGFGVGWDLPGLYFFVELGAFAETVDLGQGSYSGINAAQQAYSFSGSSFGRSVSYGVDARLSARVVGPLYTGILLRTGGGHLGARHPMHLGSSVVDTGETFEDLAVGGLIGVMAPRFAGGRLRGEVAVGARILDVDVDPASCRPGYLCAAEYARALVEPRVVFDAWLNPWWSTSAWVAFDAIHPDGAVGLSLAFHLRSFDGAR